MRTKQRRHICVVHILLLRRADRQNVEYCAFLRWRSESPQESFRLPHLYSEQIDLVTLIWLAGVTSKDKDLEASVSGQEVLQLEYSPIGGADKDLGLDTLSDDQVRGVRLVSSVDN